MTQNGCVTDSTPSLDSPGMPGPRWPRRPCASSFPSPTTIPSIDRRGHCYAAGPPLTAPPVPSAIPPPCLRSQARLARDSLWSTTLHPMTPPRPRCAHRRAAGRPRTSAGARRCARRPAAPGNCRQSLRRRPGGNGVGLRQPDARPHTAPRQQGADARGTGQPQPPSRTLNPAGALLRSRPAAVCRQPRCASHHQATHTGRLSTIA